MKDMKEIFMYILAGVVILMIFAVVGVLMFRTTPTENSELLYTALGLALGWGTTVIQYFFGSSKSSADKTELLNESNNLNT
jgi:hypothetical protein